MKKSLVLVLSLAAFSVPRAEAAFININDSNLNTITITAGDFENGFSVDGNLLTSGLGSSASVTLADGNHAISGSWQDNGAANGADLNVLFALVGAPTQVTSGITFHATSNGFFATLTGSIDGFTGAPFFATGLPTFSQNGGTRNGGVAFLSSQFIPEAAPVPEPATLTLVGSGLALIAIRRRRRAAR